MRLGDTGTDITTLQRTLNKRGLTVAVDGWYGPATEAAVRQLQATLGLVADGIAGPKTLEAMAAGSVPAHRLTQAAIDAAAVRLDVPVASILAVNEVESSGSGFLPDGRPVILYERHQMHRLLAEKGADVAILAAMYPNLVNPKRGGYSGGGAEHSRLSQAKLIDTQCALLATSWGSFQIMGFNYESCGWPSVEQFVADLSASEVHQLNAFIGVIESDQSLLKALKAKKWADFAKLYNGPAYKDNYYDIKLARAYDRHSAALEPQGETA